MIKVTLAQLNVTVGDMDGNVRKMIAAAQRARDDAADLVVFSELSLTGYYPGDLLDEPHFMARVAVGFEALLQASRQMPALHWVVGLPAAHTGPGKPLRNVLRVLRGGEVLLEYAKQLLPTYNIFNERRHFEPGPDVAKVLRIGSAQVGFLICEDGWNDDGSAYAVNPFQRLRDAAPDVVISINASPSHIGKREQRHQIFAAASHRNHLPILYVNQVGGHDQLVYDGASFAVDPKAGVVFEARRFEEDVTTLRIDAHGFKAADGEPLPTVASDGLPTMAFYRQQIVLGLSDYARRCGFTQAVVGSSGGIDSAITPALAGAATRSQISCRATAPVLKPPSARRCKAWRWRTCRPASAAPSSWNIPTPGATCCSPPATSRKCRSATARCMEIPTAASASLATFTRPRCSRSRATSTRPRAARSSRAPSSRSRDRK